MDRLRRTLASDHVAGWAFVAPALLLIVVFGILPIIWGFVLSFQKSDLIDPNTPFVGLANYRALAHDHVLRIAAGHTLVYTGVFVPVSVIGALFVAVALNRKIALIRFYRTSVFVPVVASTIATSIMFLWLLDKNYGLANWLLGKIGLGPFGFFDSPHGALYSIIAMTVWGWIGFDVIIYLAALQGIPEELVEAAEIDGASRWSIFGNVTVPLLGPATLLLVVWSSINALQLFDEIYFVTHGGPPPYNTAVVVWWLFSMAFRFGAAGYAAATAYVLFLAILVLTMVQFWVGNRVVHYSS
jgi:multiple sugar transport system permease protein